MKTYSIKISGSGTLDEIKEALANLAQSIEEGDRSLEDSVLIAEISEE